MAVTETRIVTKRLRDRPDDSWTIDGASRPAAYEVLRKALGDGARRDVQEQVKASGLRGRGGAGFGTGQKWSFLPKGIVPALPRGERRRGRAVHVQGPHAPRARPAPDRRGRRSSPRSRSRRHHAFIYVRGEFALGIRAARAGDRRRVREGLPRQEHPRLRLRPRDRRAPRRRRLHLRRRDRRCSRASRASAAMPRIKPPFPAIAGPLREADRRQQRRDAVDRPAHHAHGRRGVRQARRRTAPPARASSRCRVTSSGPATTRSSSASRSATSSTGLAGGVRGGKQMKFFIPGGASSPWLMARRAPRRAARHGLRRQQSSETMLGSGRGHGVRRDDRPGRSSRGGSRSSSRTRVRQVHAVPRGLGLAREGAVPDVARPRPPRGPRPAARRSATTSSPGLERAVRADHDLPARAERDVGRRQPRPLLPRRDPRDVPPATRSDPGDERMTDAE